MVQATTRRADSAPQGGGTIPGTPGEPAFTVTRRSGAPVVVAVPHAGRRYPDGLRHDMRYAAEAMLRLEDRFADLLAEAVARATGASLIVAHAPRAMIDLNRSPEDVDWEMVAGGGAERRPRHAAGRRARSGLGLVPRRLPGIGELWKRPMPQVELEARLAGIHRPYHAAIGRLMEGLRDQWGAALLIDLHSMPPLGPKRGSEASPDFVVGDRFGSACDAALSATALDHLAAAGHRAAHNRPYAGGYGLDRHSAPTRGLHAVQIEVCRAIYLDAALKEPAPAMADVIRVLTGLVQRLADEVTAGRRLPLAAE